MSDRLVRTHGVREALRVLTASMLWAMFVVAEDRMPEPREYREAFGLDEATVFRRRQHWREAFPDGPSWEEFTERLAREVRAGRGLSAHKVGKVLA